jgi:hypothetical protein
MSMILIPYYTVVSLSRDGLILGHPGRRLHIHKVALHRETSLRPKFRQVGIPKADVKVGRGYASHEVTKTIRIGL